MSKELGVLLLASWGVPLALGSFTHNPLISEMSPKGDSEHFSVNCSFYIILDASSPSAGLCGDSRPHRDQDVPRRHRPSCQCSREIAVTHTGQEDRTGAIGEARTRERLEGGEHKPTRARATGQRGWSPDTPHPRFGRPFAGDLSQLKRQRKTGLIGPFPSLLPIFPAAAPPPGNSHPCLYYRISWEASPSSAQRWGSTRSWDGGEEGEKP